MEVYLGEEILIKNKVIGDFELINSSIEFKGENNIFYSKANLKNSKIRFTGNNALIFIDECNNTISIDVRISNDSVMYFGKNSYLNKKSSFYVTERKNIIIGNECLISYDSTFRTADPHLIYDISTKERINYSKSILIGDHVWIGQNSLILKNSIIGSGSIIGGGSVLSNKMINSNTIYAGNPAKKIKDNIFFVGPYSTHDYTMEDEINSRYNNDTNGIFEIDNNTISLKDIDDDLQKITDVDEKLQYVKNNLSNNINKNRFSIK